MKEQAESLEMQLARKRGEESAEKFGGLPHRAFELSRLRPIRMRITTDLTRYHPGLVSGLEGTTQFEGATSGVWCHFLNIGRCALLSRSCELIML